MRLSLHQFAMKRKKKSMVPCPVTSILAAADYGGAGEPHAMVRLLGVAGFEGDSGGFGEWRDFRLFAKPLPLYRRNAWMD